MLFCQKMKFLLIFALVSVGQTKTNKLQFNSPNKITISRMTPVFKGFTTIPVCQTATFNGSLYSFFIESTGETKTSALKKINGNLV